MNFFTKKRNFKIFVWAVVIGFVSSILVSLLSEFNLIKHWELKTYDLRMRLLREGEVKPDDVVLFYIDELSLRQMEEQGLSWPWPRELYTSALKFAEEGGARAVVFDLFFSEDSVYGVDDDIAFANGIGDKLPVYFVLFLSKNISLGDEREAQVLEKSRIPIDSSRLNWIEPAHSMNSMPIQPLLDAARGFGNAQIPPDEDGVYRRVTLVEKLNRNVVPSIALKVVQDIENIKNIEWPEKSYLILRDSKIPLDENGKMMINYYGGTDTFPNYSLAEVIVSQAEIEAGKVPGLKPDIVKDKVVVVGVASPGLYDTKATPFSRVSPGPEIHATVIENLIDEDYMMPLGRDINIIIIFFFGLAAAVGLALISSTWGIVLWILFLSTGLLGFNFFMFSKDIWMTLVPPLGALIISAFAMIFFRFMTEGRKKREIKKAFSQYLSPDVVKEIADDPEALKLGGEEKEITILFSDIADFTSIAERISPADLVEKLNEYFSMATKVIQENGGTLDKYIGDAIMAFWNAPLKTVDHASRAVKSALEIQKALLKDSEFVTRIGIHTSSAVVGNIGSDIRFNYTAIGDAVNLASRLEGLNKKYGTNIILSETSKRQIDGQIETRKIGRVRVKGREEPIDIYEPIGLSGDYGKFSMESYHRFNDAMDLFEKAKFADAERSFEMIESELGDPVSTVYKSLCREYKENPPEEFDGVVTFTTK